jgi:hypothetical protein
MIVRGAVVVPRRGETAVPGNTHIATPLEKASL